MLLRPPKVWELNLSSLLKAWYTFLALGLLTFIMTAFIGIAPVSLSSAVALPHQLLFRASLNLREAIESMVDRREFRAEVLELEQELADLKETNRRLELDLERYSQALRVQEFQSPAVVATAPVTGVDPSPILARITLGRGSSRGVRENMPVTVPEGLVGLVTEITPRSAVVRAVTDPESRIGVTVRGRGGQGIARGELGGLIRVVNYYENDPVRVGDEIETSSRGGLFPRGILVGEVIEVFAKKPNSLRIEFLVRPAVDMPGLQVVSLIDPL